MFPFGALGAQGHRESSGPKGDWKSWSEKTSAPAIAPRGRPFCESAQVHSTMFGRDAPGAKTVQNIRVISLKMASCRTCVATATKIDTRAARDVALVVDNVETLSAARRKWPVARAPAQRRNRGRGRVLPLARHGARKTPLAVGGGERAAPVARLLAPARVKGSPTRATPTTRPMLISPDIPAPSRSGARAHKHVTQNIIKTP